MQRKRETKIVQQKIVVREGSEQKKDEKRKKKYGNSSYSHREIMTKINNRQIIELDRCTLQVLQKYKKKSHVSSNGR